ncbi:MAG: hypothetical protein JNM18_21640 [Planctomycetaceae bacterium]|nr:hypothetical protein [Planctomycetaceae bacterium]
MMLSYEELVAFRDAAWTCNERAIEFFNIGRSVGLSRSRYGTRPYFEPAATRQAIQFIDMTRSAAEKIAVSVAVWNKLAHSDSESPLLWIKTSLDGQGRTFCVADKSAYTAHAAAELMALYALEIWEKCGDTDEKRFALEIVKYNRSAKKLRNLHGYIESECERAVTALDETVATNIKEPVESVQEQSKTTCRLSVNERDRTVTLDGITYHVELPIAKLFDAILKAGGERIALSNPSLGLRKDRPPFSEMPEALRKIVDVADKKGARLALD